MDINFKEICDGRTAIHTPSEEDARQLIDAMQSFYGSAIRTDTVTLLGNWRRYKTQTCYRIAPFYKNIGDELPEFISCTYCKKSWYDERRYPVLEFSNIVSIDLGEFDTAFVDSSSALAALF